MTDAMLEYRLNQSTTADCAIINSGGIRATIDAGEITRGEVLTAFPFGNAVVEIKLSGADVWDVIEGIVSDVNVKNGKEVTSFFQISTGIKVQYNPDAVSGGRLVAVEIDGEPLDEAKEYGIVTLDFLAGGGDNIFTATKDFVTLDTQDEVLVQYVKKTSPIDISLDGRIEKVSA